MKKIVPLHFLYPTKYNKDSGFTLIEILVVIGIIAVLAAIVVIAINPSRQFAQARNTDRTASIQTILNAVGQRIADNKGLFRSTTDTVCTSAMDISTSTTAMTIASSTATNINIINLRPCLVPTYMSELPVDPTTGVPWTTTTDTYNTGYTIAKDATTGRITVTAPVANSASELSQTISSTR